MSRTLRRGGINQWATLISWSQGWKRNSFQCLDGFVKICLVAQLFGLAGVELEMCVTDRHLSRCFSCLIELFLMLKAHYGSRAKFKLPQIWKGWEIWLISNILTQSWAHCSIHCQPLAINTTCKFAKIHFPCKPFGAPFGPVEEFRRLELDCFSGAFEVILGRLIRTPSLCRAVEVFWAHPTGRRPRGHALNCCRYSLICSGHFSRFSRWSFGVVAQLAEHLHLLTVCRGYGDKNSGRMRGTERKM